MAKAATQAMNYELVSRPKNKIDRPKKLSGPYTDRVRAPKSRKASWSKRVQKRLAAAFNYRRMARAVAAVTLLAFGFVGILEITAPMGYTPSFFFSVVMVFLLIDTAWRKN